MSDDKSLPPDIAARLPRPIPCVFIGLRGHPPEVDHGYRFSVGDGPGGTVDVRVWRGPTSEIYGGLSPTQRDVLTAALRDLGFSGP